MQITLRRINKTVLFVAQNERGYPALVEEGTNLRGESPRTPCRQPGRFDHTKGDQDH